jgi:uncharacterized glyoxalase superfamily protein PhnB
MTVTSCIPVVPSHDLRKSLRLWVGELGFEVANDMTEDGALVWCMLSKRQMAIMLNRRVGKSQPPEDYEGVRFYWAPTDLSALHERLKVAGFEVSDITDRDYGRTEFVLVDDDGFSHCFGVETR